MQKKFPKKYIRFCRTDKQIFIFEQINNIVRLVNLEINILFKIKYIYLSDKKLLMLKKTLNEMLYSVLFVMSFFLSKTW